MHRQHELGTTAATQPPHQYILPPQSLFIVEMYNYHDDLLNKRQTTSLLEGCMCVAERGHSCHRNYTKYIDKWHADN